MPRHEAGPQGRKLAIGPVLSGVEDQRVLVYPRGESSLPGGVERDLARALDQRLQYPRGVVVDERESAVVAWLARHACGLDRIGGLDLKLVARRERASETRPRFTATRERAERPSGDDVFLAHALGVAEDAPIEGVAPDIQRA